MTYDACGSFTVDSQNVFSDRISSAAQNFGSLPMRSDLGRHSNNGTLVHDSGVRSPPSLR